jgi:hypothetical protein
LQDHIRAFNRLWTGRIGLLSQSYLVSGLGLTDARVLHDLADGRRGGFMRATGLP